MKLSTEMSVNPIKWKEPVWLLSGEQARTGGPTMAKEKKKNPVPLPKKTYWHLYSLQNLQSEKLAVIINKILRSECQVIK